MNRVDADAMTMKPIALILGVASIAAALAYPRRRRVLACRRFATREGAIFAHLTRDMAKRHEMRR